MTDLDSSVLKARNILLSMFCMLTILDIVLVIVSQDLWAIGRVIVTAVVMYYVLQGKKWAKWVLIGILSLVIVLLTALIIALYSQLSNFLIIGSIILVIIDLATIMFLISSKELDRYFLVKKRTAATKAQSRL